MLLQLQSSKADESKLARLEEALSQAQAENYKKERQLTSLRTQLSEVCTINFDNFIIPKSWLLITNSSF